MILDDFIIYQDEETGVQVAINAAAHQFFQENCLHYFFIDKSQHMLLLSYVANKILDKDSSQGQKTVMSSNKVFQLKHDELLEFNEPFDYFTNAAVIIADTDDFEHKLTETEKEINEFYDDKNFSCEIFPFPLFNIWGYFCEIDEEHIKILFFSYRKD